MPIVVFIAGDPGTGKSTSIFPHPKTGIKGIPPEKIVYVSCGGAGKRPRIKDAKTVLKIGTPISKGGHFFQTKNFEHIKQLLDVVDNQRPDIKVVVLDDVDLLMSHVVLTEESKMDYDDWRALGVRFYTKVLGHAIENLKREDLFIVMMFHLDMDKMGGLQVKTAGQLINNYAKPESLVDYLIITRVQLDPASGQTVYQFVTNRAGNIPAKSPIGVFDDKYMPNDLGLVIDNICEFEGLEKI